MSALAPAIVRRHGWVDSRTSGWYSESMDYSKPGILTLLGRYTSTLIGTDEQRLLAMFFHAMECRDHWASTGCKNRHIREAIEYLEND